MNKTKKLVVGGAAGLTLLAGVLFAPSASATPFETSLAPITQTTDVSKDGKDKIKVVETKTFDTVEYKKEIENKIKAENNQIANYQKQVVSLQIQVANNQKILADLK